MVLKRHFEEGLAHASYVVGCPDTGEAVVIDPNRNFEQYEEAAAKEKLKITMVAETHIHADFLSGARELAKRTGATLCVSDEGDADWKYAFAREPNVRLLKHGDRIDVGTVRLTAKHTPGHTPEHLSYLLTQLGNEGSPNAAFTGDFLFVGDVGRPDLLESAAGVVGASEPAARALYRSLQEFRNMPENLLIWPAHGAGSACGKALGSAPNSILGNEIATNWAFQFDEEDGFVRAILEGQPTPPPYFARMKQENKSGPAPRAHDNLASLTAIPEKAFVLDVRPTDEYRREHLAGSLHIPLERTFTMWSGWLVPQCEPVAIVASGEAEARRAMISLSLIGTDNVIGWIGPPVISQAPNNRQKVTLTTVARQIRPEALVLDVRYEDEWSAGHIDGSFNIPLTRLNARLNELPKNRPIEVHCETGQRAAIAVSILEGAGFANVRDVTDGYSGFVELKRSKTRI